MVYRVKNFFKKLFGGTGAIAVGAGLATAQDDFPPKPTWSPEFTQSIEETTERCFFYLNRSVNIVVFKHGTCVLVEDLSSEESAVNDAKEVLKNIINYHPDMNPLQMKDGNVLVQYNHPAFNVVLKSTFENYKSQIEDNHLKGLTRDEVLVTPLGRNKFDEFGMQALYGRTLMFLDATKPEVVKILKAENAG